MEDTKVLTLGVAEPGAQASASLSAVPVAVAAASQPGVGELVVSSPSSAKGVAVTGCSASAPLWSFLSMAQPRRWLRVSRARC